MDALEILVGFYQDRVYRIAYGLLQHREDSLDVTQEAFLRVFQGIGKFAENASFYTWLYRIVVNLCHDSGRKKGQRKGEFSYEQASAEREEQGRPPLELADEDAVGQAEILADREIESKVYEVIESLPEKHRTAILLREVENMSYQEIAEATGVSVGTVMSRLHHARKKLQELLKPFLETD